MENGENNFSNEKIVESGINQFQKYCQPYYDQFIKENVFDKYNFKDKIDLLKAVANGKVNIEEVRQKVMTLAEFTSFYFPKELPINTKLKDNYKLDISIFDTDDISCFQVLPNRDIIAG